MSVYVLDANIVSYYLKGNSAVVGNIDNALAAGDDLIIAPIAYYEVRRGLLAIGSKRRMDEFSRFCNMLAVGRLDNSILDTAADIYDELRKAGRLTDDADIFIAAFCRYHGFKLVTNNIKHFNSISGLDVIDWAV